MELTIKDNRHLQHLMNKLDRLTAVCITLTKYSSQQRRKIIYTEIKHCVSGLEKHYKRLLGLNLLKDNQVNQIKKIIYKAMVA